MLKRENLIARLLNRGAAPDKAPAEPAPQDDKIVVIVGGEDDSEATESDDTTMSQDQISGEPTICKDGTLYRARLRGGRWESFGAPIGHC